MGDCTLLEKFDEEYEGISYNGEIFYDKVNKISFCKIYFNLTGFDKVIQKDSYMSAVSEVEKKINEHLYSIQIEKTTKKFLIIPIKTNDFCWEIESYYQDFDNYDETQWISLNDDNCVMSEVAPGVWEYDNNYFLSVETTLSFRDINKKMDNELYSFILKSLKDVQKTLVVKVKDFEKKVKK